MSSQAGRGLRPGSVVRAFIRLLVLVVFGFGAGLLFGIVSEEPELLAGHLRGESESIALTANDLGAAEAGHPGGSDEVNAHGNREEERVFALPSVAASASNARPATRAQATRDLASPNVGAGSSLEDEGAWAIQVGAFSDEGAALRLAESLRAKGYPAELLSAQGDAGRWRVRVQPMLGEATARETAAKLKRAERLPTWVLRMETS